MELSYRDQVAIAAMQGLLSHNGWHPEFVLPESFKFGTGLTAQEALTRAAYAYADAMIKARGQ